ncbi:putrescine transport system permease protein [Xanthobacter flavus]|uniref:Putrescine transport system permease protein n=1 Tax=Xanthobacter flavus TaxID=281 RepID=A0A9W6FMP8_XANFL|nr:ABC transporter permease subunit [Xanthobacter flavus]MDR6334815.1 putrescine transport system permease protein [Xanthobacter flavus]GLI23163.1 putrescine/spermidine ABC transporter permease [Xanthobacter flavus]
MAMAGEKGRGRWVVIAVPYLWLLALFLAPFLIVFKISLSQDVVAQPPYAPQLDLSSGLAGITEFLSGLSFANYGYVLDFSNEFLEAYGSSLVIASISTVLLLLVGYPIAYGMARAPRSIQPTLLMLVILPFWTSFLIRVYAWIGILSPEGLLNQGLMALGVIDTPLEILNTNLAVYIGIVYSYLPFMVLPLYSALEKLDLTLLEAAADLGCPPVKAFWKITFPLSIPGVAAGALLCFIPAVGEFVIPDLLGGSDTLMIGKSLWTEFTVNRSWTVSSAVAVLLLLVLVIPIVIYQNIQQRELEAGK